MRSTLGAIALATTIALSGCASMSPTEQNVAGGAAIGALGGAAIGGLTGGSVGTGALIGGALGAGGGYLYDRDQRSRW